MNTVHWSQVHIPENRIRRNFNEEAIEKLADSIESKGLLHPIVLRYDKELSGVLVAGERRLRAMELLAESGRDFRVVGDDHETMTELPPGHVPYHMLSELSEDDILEAELEENSIRQDLSWQETAAAIGRLHKLRKSQDPKRTYKQTNEEVYAEAGTVQNQPHYQKTKSMILLSENLTDDLVRTAKDPGTAMRMLRKQAERDLASDFASYLKTKGEDDDDKIQLIHGDGIDFMRGHPREFDVIATDPPYGIDADRFHNYDSVQSHEYSDSEESFRDLMARFAPASTHTTATDAHMYCFCDIRHWHYLCDTFSSAGWIVWPWPIIWTKKGHGLVPSEENGPSRAHEYILYARKGHRKVTAIRPDVIVAGTESDKIHAAQKPVALLKDLISRSLLPGEGRILDPFCGSGTTLIAARELQQECVGIEIDKLMYDRASIRLVTEQMEEEG